MPCNRVLGAGWHGSGDIGWTQQDSAKGDGSKWRTTEEDWVSSFSFARAMSGAKPRKARRHG